MDTAIVQQFLNFFEDFLGLCQMENWPNNDTTETEFKNAFLVSQHVGKCLDKFQKKNLLQEFLSALKSSQDMSKLFLKNCFSDPPKYILKKIINSNSTITQMDVGFKVFLQLFSEEELENYLTDFMVEAASKETLLRNLSTEFSKEQLIEFKSQLLLMELITCADPKDSLKDLIHTSNKDTIELLVVSSLNKDYKYHNLIKYIVNAFTQVMLGKNHRDKPFWKSLFNIEDTHFVQLCLVHGDLFKIIVTALLDCGMLLRENLSAEFFYIDLTYSELVFTVRRICKNENLKVEFFDIVGENSNLAFWENMLS